MTHGLSDIVIVRSEDGWTAHPGSGMLFSASGCSPAEAIGAMLISNREAVGLEYCIVDGDQFKVSTRYGKSRSVDELGTKQLEARDAWLQR